MERQLRAMKNDWEPVAFVCASHRDTGTFILRGEGVDEAQTLLDDHIIKTQTIKGLASRCRCSSVVFRGCERGGLNACGCVFRLSLRQAVCRRGERLGALVAAESGHCRRVAQGAGHVAVSRAYFLVGGHCQADA